jgi:serine protein kinase
MCLAREREYINPFMVLNAIKEGLTNSPLINDKEMIQRFLTAVEVAVKELDHILRNEVQKALVSNVDVLQTTCTNYINNLMADMNDTKLKDPYTGRDVAPNEQFMRQIESPIGINERSVRDFRNQVVKFIATKKMQGQEFTWDSNPQLREAFEKKVYEDVKDHVKLASLHNGNVDPEEQKKIDTIKARLVKEYGYTARSAEDVLLYVSSIFARGDSANS